MSTASRKLSLVIAVIILAAVGWYFRFWIQKKLQNLPELAQNPIINSISQNISAPPPLISNLFNQNSHLTDAGVITLTNQNRAQNGNLPRLTENPLLDSEAQSKLQDMFKNQYFEHVSPSGKGPSDLAKASGYAYISIGENLAMGNFKDDQELVTAWMNSPGHRANILDKKYQEIGVAVGQGKFQGKETWIAVQEFGQPQSSCPAVDANLKSQVDDLQNQINHLEPELAALKNQMDQANPKTPADYAAYNSEVSVFNSQVEIYNNKVDVLKLAAAQYNAEVNSYNSCADQ